MQENCTSVIYANLSIMHLTTAFFMPRDISHSVRVDGICGSGQSGTVKNGGVEKAGMDISARYGKGGHCRSKNVSKLA